MIWNILGLEGNKLTIFKKDIETIKTSMAQIQSAEVGQSNNVSGFSAFVQAIKGTKQEIVELSETDLTQFFTGYNNAVQQGTNVTANYIDTVRTSNVTMADYLAQLNGAAPTFEDYSAYCKRAASANQSLSTSSKLAAVGVGLLNAAINVGIIWLATTAIQALVGWLDDINVTAEEAAEALDEAKQELSEVTSELEKVNSELETVQSRMAELENMSSLTFTEEKEYDNLVKQNNELQRSIDLLELEQKMKSKEANKAFVESMKKTTEENSGKFYYQDTNPQDPSNGWEFVVENDWWESSWASAFAGNIINENVTDSDMLSGYQDKFKELEDLDRQYDQKEVNKNTYEETKKKIEKDIDSLYSEIGNIITDYNTQMDGIEYISEPSTEDDQNVNKWLDYINDFKDKWAIILGENNAEQNAFNRIVDNWQFDDTVQGLQNLGKEGLVTADMLDDPEYDAFINKLVEIGIIDSADNLEAIALAFNSAAIAAERANGSTKKVVSSFKDVWDSDDFKETREELLELAKSGELTAEALTSDDYKDFMSDLEGIGISAKGAKVEILSLLDATEKLSGASKNISGLENAYKEFKEKNYVTAETIESIPKVFTELETYDFDLFKNIVGNPESDVDEIQTAFNELVTAYLKEQEIFVNLTEKDKARFVSNLTEMGISNADEVVDGVLTIKDNLKDLANEAETDVARINNAFVGMGKNAITSTNDLTECTWEEIEALITSGKYYGYSSDKIKEYVAHKIWANQNSIESTADIAQLIMVAKSAGIATEAITRYEAAKKLQQQGWGGGQAQVDALMQSAYQEILKDIESLYDFEMPEIEVKGLDELSSSEEEFNWIETLFSRIDRAISNAGRTISATYKSWSDRTKAIGEETDKLTDKLKAQEDAANYYFSEANKIDLSKYKTDYKTLVENGAIDIDSISIESEKNDVQRYKELYEAGLEALDGAEDTRADIVSKLTEAFDMVASAYDSKISEIEGRGSILDAMIGQQEAKGHIVSKKYYEELSNIEKENISALQSKLDGLNTSFNEAMASGKIAEGSEDWFNMKAEIYGVEEALIAANAQLIEYSNDMRNLDWDAFDKQREAISRVTEEADFLIDLMSEEDLFDKDTGALTEYGTATMGLHAVNYNTYMKEAQDAAEQLAKIEDKIASGEYDATDDEIIQKRREYIDLQQESILAAKNEMQTLKDLKTEYYDSLINSLQEVIDKRKEALQAEKDMYDYERQISEKTKNISSLQKQINAYSGSDAEEDKAKLQKLQLELSEAQEDLKSTEWDRQLQDSQDMLEKLSSDAQDWVEAALENLETVITDAIGITNEHSSEIRETLYKIANEYGYDMTDEMKAIWDSEGDIASAFEKGEFVSTEVSILNVLEGIAKNITKMIEDGDKEAKDKITNSNNLGDGAGTNGGNTTPTTPTTPSTGGGSNGSGNDAKNDGTNNSNKKWGSWFVSKKDNTPDSKLNINTSIVDRLKWKDIDSSLSQRAAYYKAMGGKGTYSGTATQNAWMIKEMKANGFAKGGTIGSLIDKTGESGYVLAHTGEGIIPLSLMGDWKALIANLEPLNASMDFLNKALIPNIKANVGNAGNVNNDVTLNVTLPNVTNYTEFRNELIKDKTFEKAMMSINGSHMLKGNSLAKFRH